jgi:hypothetical protein
MREQVLARLSRKNIRRVGGLLVAMVMLLAMVLAWNEVRRAGSSLTDLLGL